ncbi:MAG: hypothetical protein RRY79_06890 [Clostridia bacterium]
MKRRYKNKYKSGRRKKTIGDSNLIPILKLSSCILLILAFVASIIYLLLPWGLGKLGVEFYPPFVAKPTPVPTPVPTPTPNPLAVIDLNKLQQEVVIPGAEFHWFGDPCFYGDKLMLTAGENVAGNVKMTSLFLYDPVTREAIKQSIPLKHAHFMYPVFNDKYICYLDAEMNGGGEIMVYARGSAGGAVSIKTVHVGQPKLFLSGNYLVWIERTGSSMDKLFVCDLSTMESTTLQMFSNSYYGMSYPFIYNNRIIWAGEDTDIATADVVSSMLHIHDINSAEGDNIKTNTYIHDPQYNGRYYAWLDNSHGINSSIYVMGDDKLPRVIAKGAVEFGMGDDFVAYGMDQAIYVYVFSVNETFRITTELQLTQFLGVSANHVMWMDVTSREKDIMKIADLSILLPSKAPNLGS